MKMSKINKDARITNTTNYPTNDLQIMAGLNKRIEVMVMEMRDTPAMYR